jgi:hypothetical protein
MAMNDTLKQEVNDFKFQNKSLTEASEKLESKMGHHGSYIQKLQQDTNTVLKGKLLKRPGEGRQEDREEQLDKRLKLESDPTSPGKQQNRRKVTAGLDYSLTGVTLGMVAKRPTLEQKRRLELFARSCPEWVMVATAINMDIYWICLRGPTIFDLLTPLYPHASVVM